MRIPREFLTVGLATIVMLGATGRMAAQDPEHTQRDTARGSLRVPESLRIEHEEIHSQLITATRVPGSVGVAARDLAKVLHPHFVREQQIALPPLGLLLPLSRGEMQPEFGAVLTMTDSLRAEMPRMLDEHRAIRAATLRMRAVARVRRNVAVAQLADKLALHAQSEEEIFYPAAMLVGDLVRSHLQATPAP